MPSLSPIDAAMAIASAATLWTLSPGSAARNVSSRKTPPHTLDSLQEAAVKLVDRFLELLERAAPRQVAQVLYNTAQLRVFDEARMVRLADSFLAATRCPPPLAVLHDGLDGAPGHGRTAPGAGNQGFEAQEKNSRSLLSDTAAPSGAALREAQSTYGLEAPSSPQPGTITPGEGLAPRVSGAARQGAPSSPSAQGHGSFPEAV